MTLEQEIDEIFLHNKQPTPDTKKIKNLQEFISQLECIKPHLNIISEHVVSIKTNFEIYNIQLDSLAKDLEIIQEKNRELEHNLERDKTVFELLKKLTLALSIDDIHLQILDNGSFTRVDDLVKMQESLNILAGFNVDKFTIRIVKETREKFLQCQRNFFKRFVNYQTKTFVKSESRGELRVHRDLYNKIKQYQFIFSHSKKYDDSFKMVIGAYSMHSKKLYEWEFAEHVATIGKLVNDTEKLQLSIEVLIKSFDSLVACELNFLVNLLEEERMANEAAAEIFKGVSSLIFDFLDQMFKQSQITTITSLSKILEAPSEETAGPFLRGFRKDLNGKFTLLKERFIKDEEMKLRKNIKVEHIQAVLNQKGLNDMKAKMLQMYLERYLKRVNEVSLEKLIYRYKELYSLRIPFDVERELPADTEQKSVVLGEIMRVMEARILGDVFGSENEEANIKRIVSMVKNRRMSEAENVLLKNIRGIVLENCKKEDTEKYKKQFE